MSIMFNSVLREAGFQLADVRLIRHKDNRSARGRTPYELWRDNRPLFEEYQSKQDIRNRSKLGAPYWAVFIANLNGETMFAGLYSVKYLGLLKKDSPMQQMDGVNKAGSCDAYRLTLQDKLCDLVGKLYIDWGPGALAWVQLAKRQNKAIIELRPSFQEPAFPGFLNFIRPLSSLSRLPASWIAALQSSRGVYLLTCPRTKEQRGGPRNSDSMLRWLPPFNREDRSNDDTTQVFRRVQGQGSAGGAFRRPDDGRAFG